VVHSVDCLALYSQTQQLFVTALSSSSAAPRFVCAGPVIVTAWEAPAAAMCACACRTVGDHFLAYLASNSATSFAWHARWWSCTVLPHSHFACAGAVLSRLCQPPAAALCVCACCTRAKHLMGLHYLASSSATSWGVDTITAPDSGSLWPRPIWASPVPAQAHRTPKVW
jgi:hypothetical protein